MRGARTATAYHEAGHAVVAWRLGVAVRGVSIVPDEDTSGRCHHAALIRGKYPELDDSLRAVVRMQKQVMVSLAGLIAQRIHSPRSVRRYHAHTDHRAAVDVALHLTSSEEEASAFLKWLEIRTGNLLRAHWPMVDALSKELLARGSMRGKEVERLLLASSLR